MQHVLQQSVQTHATLKHLASKHRFHMCQWLGYVREVL